MIDIVVKNTYILELSGNEFDELATLLGKVCSDSELANDIIDQWGNGSIR